MTFLRLCFTAAVGTVTLCKKLHMRDTMKITKPIVLGALTAALFLHGCGGDDNNPGESSDAVINVLSSRPDMVSGGSALISVEIPSGVNPDRIKVKRGSTDITQRFNRTGSLWVGLASDLQIGENIISISIDDRPKGQKTIKNFSRNGPIISGPQQTPWLCETEKFKLPNGSTLGPAQDEFCNAPTAVSYIYMPAGGKAYKPLLSTSTLPADMSQTTTSDGKTVNYIVRVETGTVNRAIYQYAVLFDPTTEGSPTPVAQHKGWNGKLVYVYGGSAASGYHQGDLVSSSPTDILDEKDKLAKGFAVVTSTLNIFGVMANDVVSAETTSMVKEIFIKTFGPPKYTIGTGGSGGSMQVHLIANNYPGMLDGIAPAASFPDNHSVVSPAIDCAVLVRAFNDSGMTWTDAQKTAVAGFNTWATCDSPSGAWTNNFAPMWLQAVRSSIPPFPYNGGYLELNNCSSVLPKEWVYDPISNPSGVRCDIYQAIKNQVGIDTATGQPARAYDNVGIEYGLNAYRAGAISAEQFVVLNEKAGGYDNDGLPTSSRTAASPLALKNLYQYGRINNGQNLGNIPIVDSRPDFGLVANVHDSVRSVIMRARLIRENGNAGNHVILRQNGLPIPPGAGTSASVDAFLMLDVWVSNIKNDTKQYPSALAKVTANKPAQLNDTCQDSSGALIVEPADANNSGRCGTAMPFYKDPRLVAGAPLTDDVLKCQLKPVRAEDHPGMTPVQLARLQKVFAEGVCDYSLPSMGVGKLVGTWLTYPSAGVANPLN
ncbi:hypothetical protein BJN34_22455 [Cupriavidus necator]|uniref:DUF6351 domain-containing protein n=2 Tax=Cupriavidus necator TaxID=106590 RepID=A0A1U9UVG2_CUPNE|nr:hypothetical protein BJN34_22455 [Cupriavidus necator]